ncbi:response regulator [Nitrospira sp. Nam74]
MFHLLIIDDNTAFLNAARELVLRHRSGFVVDTAPDAETALLAISRRDYDVVVTDIRLPGMQGLELLAECRRIRPATPVVMITGYGDRELEEEAARCGAYAFLHKPVTAEAFYGVLNRAALHSRTRRNRDDVSTPDRTWYTNAAEAIHRRSEAITAQLLSPLTSKDGLDIRWAAEQAEHIIDRFIDDEGSDDLLKLKDEIAHALCRAYNAGKRSALTHRSPYRVDIRPDIKT